MISSLNNTKGHTSVNNVGGVMVFVLCISLLMPYIRIKFRKNILKDSELWCRHNSQFEIYKGA